MRNPDWVRDEVILAMDLYFRAGRKQLPAEHEDVVRLSALLNRLPIHPAGARDERFRNPNGISMILGNFLGIDPERQTPGLSRNNRLQEEVWRDFGGNPSTLRNIADAIERACDLWEESSPSAEEATDEDVFPEGQLLTRLHLTRERNRALVLRKREQVLAATGCLACEACAFDFARVYGSLGEGFAECHHVVPLTELPGRRVTRLDDLAIVCANCHRILHRARPLMTVLELRALVANTGRAAANG
jgi:5-methylcytosine-specific restriction protein A